MKGRKNSNDAVARRRAMVARLHLAGLTALEISERIRETCPVSRRQVSQDIQAIRRDWISSRRDDYHALIAREIASIGEIERNAWLGWHDSRLDAVTVRTGGDVETITTVRSQAGNPACLALALDCSRRRSQLLGLDAPKKVAATTAGGDDLTPDQRRSILLAALTATHGD